jgi:hypothetical protein
LAILPSRLESWDNFRARAPKGPQVMVAQSVFSTYGVNPYAGCDSSTRPFLFVGDLPTKIPALARVVTVETSAGKEAWSLEPGAWSLEPGAWSLEPGAWSLELLKTLKVVEVDDLIITWKPGQNSALDHFIIAQGIDVGNVVVQRKTDDGLVDVAYGVDFAFAFRTFFPDAPLHQ